jgi:hypothetical protein
MTYKYVRQVEEIWVELCATTKELEEFVAMILQQQNNIKDLTQ